MATAESFGVSAQIGSGVVRGGPEVRFHEGSTRVPRGFHQGSTGVPPGFHQGSTRVPRTRVPTRFCKGCGVVRALKRAPHAVGDITLGGFSKMVHVGLSHFWESLKMGGPGGGGSKKERGACDG